PVSGLTRHNKPRPGDCPMPPTSVWGSPDRQPVEPRLASARSTLFGAPELRKKEPGGWLSDQLRPFPTSRIWHSARFGNGPPRTRRTAALSGREGADFAKPPVSFRAARGGAPR